MESQGGLIIPSHNVIGTIWKLEAHHFVECGLQNLCQSTLTKIPTNAYKSYIYIPNNLFATLVY
jgi:hypothetical protein